MPSAKRRSRKTSKDTGEGKEGATGPQEAAGGKPRGRGRKPSAKTKAGKFSLAWGGLGMLGLPVSDPFPSSETPMLLGSFVCFAYWLKELENI